MTSLISRSSRRLPVLRIIARPVTRRLSTQMRTVDSPLQRVTRTELPAISTQPFFCQRFMSDSLPAHQKLAMPALSPTMEQGNLVEWLKKEGDEICAGDSIAEIETDKATMSWESTEDGYLAKILVPEGTEGVKIGTLVAIVVEEESDVEAFKDVSADQFEGAEEPAPPPKKETKKETNKEEEEPKKESRQESQTQQQSTTQSSQSSDRLKVSPFARVRAAAQGVKGTGPGGRILAADVSASSGSQSSTPRAASSPSSVDAEYTDESISNIRKIIASRLTESKQTIPHYYLTVDVNVDKLMELRKRLNEASKGEYKLSVNDFIIKASSLALRKVPEVNSQWTDEAIRRFHNVHVNVAVNTDHGLYTPLVKNADRLGLADINDRVKSLAGKANDNKLSLDELATGTFTISNLGMFGISHFAAVINPPQACILATGGVQERVIKDGDDFRVAQFMSGTLSCDHRVVDGAVGARWLQHWKKYLEDPINMIL